VQYGAADPNALSGWKVSINPQLGIKKANACKGIVLRRDLDTKAREDLNGIR